ncbi:MAG: hypothetical protein MZU79_01055 [Anaerotruncus sp.]|nr:hypothetical protein [Anaerotruncus sp.]
MRLGALADESAYGIGESGVPLIAPFAEDLATSSSGKVHYKSIGSAPNRILVVEWLNMSIPSQFLRRQWNVSGETLRGDGQDRICLRGNECSSIDFRRFHRVLGGSH